ncbi:MAG TPA: DNA polymerase [Nitrospiraceae bacterium]
MPVTLYPDLSLPGHPDLENVRKLDLLPIPMIRQMQRYGIAIDIPYLNDLTVQLEAEMRQLELDIACEIPPEKLHLFCDLANEDTEAEDWSPINVNSGEQLAKLLFTVLGIGNGKELKLTKSGKSIKTDKKQLEVLKKEHQVIPLVLQYKERAKLVNTYTGKLPKIAQWHPKGKFCPICELDHVESTHRVHTEFPTTRADTGRLASRNPNLQNIPARTKLGRLTREGFVASPGCRIISCDFAQIELRLLAHCAAEEYMLSIFRRGGDIHLETAMRAFSISDPNKVDKLLHRAPCKNLNFGIVYGLTAKGLYDHMALTYATAGEVMPEYITEQWCEAFIQQWFGLYPAVPPYMDTQYYRARRYGLVWDQIGRTRQVPEVRSVHNRIKQAGLRQAGNMPIQSLAAALMKIAMERVRIRLDEIREEIGMWCWPLLSIHDELLTESEEDYAEVIGEVVKEEMDLSGIDPVTGKNAFLAPIESDFKISERWTK